jgi:hypothetical protein
MYESIPKIKYFRTPERALQWAQDNLRSHSGRKLSAIRTTSEIDGSDRWAIFYSERKLR